MVTEVRILKQRDQNQQNVKKPDFFQEKTVKAGCYSNLVFYQMRETTDIAGQATYKA